MLERAAKMGYTGPDAIARQLRSGRTNTFAVAFEEKLSYAFSDPFSVAWLAAFSEVMEEHGPASCCSASRPATMRRWPRCRTRRSTALQDSAATSRR